MDEGESRSLIGKIVVTGLKMYKYMNESIKIYRMKYMECTVQGFYLQHSANF